MSKLLTSSKTALFLAGRSILRGSRGITAMTIIMLTLVFLNLLFVPALFQGIIQKANDQVVTTVSGNVAVLPPENAKSLDRPDELREQILKLNTVSAVAVRHQAGIQISTDERSGTYPVTAVVPEQDKEVFIMDEHMVEGSYLAPGDENQIVLGIYIAGADETAADFYAESLKTVHAGDKVRVTLISGRMHEFTVKGIFRLDTVQADDKAYISMSDLNRLVPETTGKATSLAIKTVNKGAEQQVIEQIRPLRPDVQLQTWKDFAGIAGSLGDTLSIINTILRSIIFFVGAITVLIITYVDIVNKRRHVGIERAIGIQRGAIVASYVLKAIVLALAGMALGLAMFLYILVPYFISNPLSFPTGLVSLNVDYNYMFRTAVFLLIVAMVAAWLPAWRSVRIKILDAIFGNRG